MNPENVCGDDLNSPRFDFEQFLFPLIFWITRVVKLAHQRKPRCPIHHEITIVGAKDMAAGRLAADPER